MMIDYRLDVERKNNFDINRKTATQSIIQTVEQLMQSQKSSEYNKRFL